jgi:hypothetical protein
VWDIEAQYLTYLRVASTERKKWQAAQQAATMDDG